MSWRELNVRPGRTYQIKGPLAETELGDEAGIKFNTDANVKVNIGFSIKEKIFMKKGEQNNDNFPFQVRIGYTADLENDTTKIIEVGRTYMYEEVDHLLKINHISFPNGCPEGVTIEIYGSNKEE